jgi:23S rRNA (cytosine1962-C5)-methyltransferase
MTTAANPFDPAQHRTLVLKRGKERVIANRHPWIFAGAIHVERGPEDAAFATLVDGDGKRIASGFYSRHSQIRLRAIAFGEEALTADMIAARIRNAIARRAAIFDEGTNCARLIHAEGDDLSGLVVDRYNDLVVIEIANRGIEQIKELIAGTLDAPRVFFKNDLPVRELERLPTEDEYRDVSSRAKPVSSRAQSRDPLPGDGEGASAGDPSTSLGMTQGSLGMTQGALGMTRAAADILESGLKFRVDASGGQKTGFFLDQRENRRMARTLAKGKRTLNLFSYTGAFGVYAAAGGASSVMNVDVSQTAIEMARHNHALNGLEAEFAVADAFQWVRQHREQYGLVICDPPAFAKSRGEVDRAARGYKDINLHALRMTEPGGSLMTFSCSGHLSLDLFQKVIFAAAVDAGRRVSIVRRLSAGPDHPVSLYCPEGEYLKGFLLEVH